jgi:NAD(P)-dependent dehydrogenase (short-subunit alcohol dehydrogenase family)
MSASLAVQLRPETPSGTGGLGAQSVYAIAKHRPSAIFFTGRRVANAEAVIARVKADTPDVSVSFIECDLASLASVKAAAERFLAVSDRLDVLMCNAGIMAIPPGLTKDGFEIQFGTNHVGHALLIQKLLPVLLRTAAAPGADVRVINLTSQGFRMHPRGDGIRFDTLNTTQDFGMFGPWLRYGQSKLANLLYARELARRHPELTVLSIHPGLVGTDLADGISLVQRTLVKGFVSIGLGAVLSPEQGAYNQLWGAFGEKSTMVNGQMYEPMGKLTELDIIAKDDQLAARLWEWTEEMLVAY